jgi:hypothetical protein
VLISLHQTQQSTETPFPALELSSLTQVPRLADPQLPRESPLMPSERKKLDGEPLTFQSEIPHSISSMILPETISTVERDSTSSTVTPDGIRARESKSEWSVPDLTMLCS